MASHSKIVYRYQRSDSSVICLVVYSGSSLYKGNTTLHLTNGRGVVLEFRTFPDGGWGVVCESSDVRKFLKKYFHNGFLNISQSSITVSVVLF